MGTPGGIDASALLTINSTTLGFLPPRMTETERNAIASPADGLIVYNSTSNKTNFREGGAWVSGAVGPTGATGATGADGSAFLTVNSQSADYTCVLGDAGGLILHPSSDANARQFSIPAHASVAYTNGTTLTFCNMSANNVTIVINTQTLYFAGTSGLTGSRNLAQYGIATAVKLDSSTWIIGGAGIG
jgi:hypothetical protein